jgi:hypothetical protein
MTASADAWRTRVKDLEADLEANRLFNDDEIMRLWDLLSEAKALLADDTLRRTYVAPDGDTIEIKLTGEGVIADAFRNGRCVGTWARTSDEMIEWVVWLGEVRRGIIRIPDDDDGDTEAINEIVRILNANDEWSSDEIERVAHVIGRTRGYTVTDGIAKFGPTQTQ